VLGGTLHFLLGYVALSPISSRSVAIGCYFGLVFAAGHLVHETRDHDADQRNGIRTNAVAFGKKASFIAGTLLFSMAYITLTLMALRGLVPSVLSLAIVFYAIHLCATWRALRDGLTYASVRRLQSIYRNIHVLIGLVMLTTVPPW
jgi:4-hydroxybenzoate polyprenyltransferase